MTEYNMPKDVLDIIKGLEKRIDRLESGSRAGNTSIDNGALVVKSADGNIIAAWGDMDSAGAGSLRRPDGTTQMGIIMRRDTGELAFTMYDPLPLQDGYQQYWGMYDLSGNLIFGDDVNSRTGLARPYIPTGEWVNANTTAWAATTSATFVPAMDCGYNVQHPKIYIDALMYCDASTSGEIRFTINDAGVDVQYGPTIAGGAGYTLFTQVLTLPASYWGTTKMITIQHRRTAGTGSVRSAVRGSLGRQS